MINFEDFEKLDIRIGTIKSVEKMDGADRLLIFKVDVGEDSNSENGREERQIISGVAEYFAEPEILIGKQVPVLMNLESRKIMGHESQGMILYVSGGDELTTLEPGKEMTPGTPVK